MDIPLFITIGKTVLSISWQKFDELAIEFGRVLPFSLSDSTVRWVCEGLNALDSILGEKIVSVSLGRGEMSIEERDVEIWTRLFIVLGNGTTLEIFNALDENGFDLITSEIEGEVKKCI